MLIPLRFKAKLPQLYATHKTYDESYPFSDVHFVQGLHDLHLETRPETLI